MALRRYHFTQNERNAEQSPRGTAQSACGRAQSSGLRWLQTQQAASVPTENRPAGASARFWAHPTAAVTGQQGSAGVTQEEQHAPLSVSGQPFTAVTDTGRTSLHLNGAGKPLGCLGVSVWA